MNREKYPQQIIWRETSFEDCKSIDFMNISILLGKPFTSWEPGYELPLNNMVNPYPHFKTP